MQIDEKFRLVLPVRFAEDGIPLLRLYHTPISREIFEANYRIIGATFSALMQPSARIGAPRIAALRLRDEGAADAREHGTLPADGGAVALLGEIRRLSCVLAPQGAQWAMVPVDAAISQGVIDEEEWREAESALVFFTCLYTMVTKQERARMMEAVVSAIGGSITFLQPMEFAASLTT